jgi:predicted RNase H-like nuclease
MLVIGRLQGISLFPQQPEVIVRFSDVLDYKPAFDVVALHTPVGLLSTPRPGGRTCERAARALLGWPRLSAISSAPVRAALVADSYETARAANGGRLSAPTWSQMDRIREVATEMQPYWQRVVYEVNPELAFHQLNDEQPLRYGKRTFAGMQERRELLERRLPGVERVLDTQCAGANQRHVVDAVADLWTARRIASRAVHRLPDVPEWDDEGLRMEILT